ncbi:AraC family transcriptional regulator [Epilithonimonas sp.]|uniref:AraC family transcriptional regulator n=1 Tax=Epilithonimonas sp. TaxID=2894511 RepID=UPI00289A02CE|nr:AraC family transcriptional regulator [Epilithonimonas sp.]
MSENEEYRNFRIAVPTDYEDIFTHFYFAENKSGKTITRTLLPSFQTILIFDFGAKSILHSKNNTKIEIDRCIVLGPIKQSFEYSLPKNSEILVANFKDDAFFRFFGSTSIAEHFPINPDDLLEKNCFNLLWTELNKIESTENRINYLLDFCKPYLRQRNGIVEKLINFTDENLNPIKSIASQENQTARNIQLHQKKHLGYTSKEINRYSRFVKCIRLIQDSVSISKKIDWFEIVDGCGYYDQSQLIHDFKYYINQSPKKYLKFQRDICNPKTE